MWHLLLVFYLCYCLAYIINKLWQERKVHQLQDQAPTVGRKQRVIVIGAGPGGLTTIKQLKDEGHDVFCIEKYGDLGGVFFASNEKGGVYDSALLTISSHMMAFSDFPPQESVRWWQHEEYMQYLKSYAVTFDLFRHIQFNSAATKITKDVDGWTVHYAYKGEERHEHFDAVAVCCGAHHVPYFPNPPGIETFTGEVHHAATYKNSKIYQNKKVVCVGIGETAADVVYEVAQAASECTLSMRRKPWVINRNPYFPNYPNDLYTTRFRWSANPKIYDFLLTSFYWVLIHVIGIRNPHARVQRELCEASGGGPSSQFLVKNERFIDAIVTKKCQPRGAIDRIEKDTVYFQDGSSVQADMILFCCGYISDITLVENMRISNVREMFKHAFHPKLGASICFIGWARPNTGGVPACAEMQARYFALLLSGKRSLPANWEGLTKAEAIRDTTQFHNSARLNTLVQYSTFMEDLAKLIGCQLPLFSIAVTDFRLWFRLAFAAQYPSQYRLRGPHSLTESSMKFLSRVPFAPYPFTLRVVNVFAPVLTWSIHVLSAGFLFGRPLAFDKTSLWS